MARRRMAGFVLALGVALSSSVAPPGGPSAAATATASIPVEVLGLPVHPGVADAVVRVYLATLGRRPGAEALALRTSQYVDAGSLTRVAQLLMASGEHERRVAGLSDAQFVGFVFRSALGREPDDAGLRYWTGEVIRVGRPAVAARLAQSSEAVAFSATTPPVPVPWRPRVAGVALGVSDSVTRLYAGLLHRWPDRAGMAHWVDVYARTRSLETVMGAMTATAEYAAAFPAEDAAAHVARLYRRVLRREPEPTGLDYWATTLAAGRVTRTQLAVALTESAELVARTRTAKPLPPPMVLYLTFDDGPSPDWTPLVLDQLSRHGARASFFVLGQEVVRRPGAVLEMVRRGHTVQNHTWGHPFLTRVSDAAVHNELEMTSQAIAGVVGRRPSCMRPPGGYIDGRVSRIAGEHGMVPVMWDIESDDWRGRPAEWIAGHVLANARHGSVVLFHDGLGNHANTIQALGLMLPALRERGFVFHPVCP